MRIVPAAIASRACALLLALASDLLLPDHEAEGVLMPEFGAGCETAWLRTFARWDAAHFLHVARHGWDESIASHAFFPLYPLLLRAGAWALGPLAGGALCAEERLVAVGLLLSNVAFVGAAWLLEALGRTLLNDPALAHAAALLFCVSPASVFFSSVYTESPFAAATFGGALLLAARRPNLGAAALCVASCLRSNGTLGTILVLADAAARAPHRRRARHVDGPSVLRHVDGRMARHVASTCARCAAVLAPYALWQVAGYARVCSGRAAPAYAAWCTRRLPDLYATVQADYWSVGIFRSYTWRQLPNFALAAPPLALCACACAGALAARRGIRASRAGARAPRASRKSPRGGGGGGGGCCWRAALACTPHPNATAHVAYWAAISIVCALVANVGVTPRLVCASCAAYYWCVAALVRRGSPATCHARAALICHVVGYAVVGTVLHANWYPYV